MASDDVDDWDAVPVPVVFEFDAIVVGDALDRNDEALGNLAAVWLLHQSSAASDDDLDAAVNELGDSFAALHRLCTRPPLT